MKADETLDIRSLALPYCLLIYKSTIGSMKPGTVLEVRVRDPESIKDLLTILDRSEDKILDSERNDDCMRLWVRKGQPGNLPYL